MKHITVVFCMLITLLSCTSGSESTEGDALASSKTNKDACDCIEVMRSTLDSINTLEEFLNVETTLKNAAPECEEIMTQSSAEEFVMKNCFEVASELEIVANEKLASFYNDLEAVMTDELEGLEADTMTTSDSIFLEGAFSDSVLSEEE